jgi:hypothetical protein
VINSVNIVPDVVVRGEQATFTAAVSNAASATWAWSIIDPATGAVLRQATTPDTMTATLDVDSTPTDLRLRLDVSTTAGAAPTFTQDFTTTASATPQIESVSANPSDAGVNQPIDFTAVERAAGARASWSWTIAGPDGTLPPIPVTAGSTLTRAFSTPGSYTATLTASFDRGTDSRPTTFTVSDHAVLAAVGTGSVDVQSNHGTAQVRLTGSFVPHTATVSTASWLTPDRTSLTVQPDGTATVSLTVTGQVPIEGDNPGAITFRLDNNSTVTYTAVGNRPPVVHVSCTLSSGQVTFLADTDLGSDFQAVLALSAAPADTYNMQRTGQNFEFFKILPVSALPDVQTWTATVTDIHNLSTPATGARCW